MAKYLMPVGGVESVVGKEQLVRICLLKMYISDSCQLGNSFNPYYNLLFQVR